MIQLDHQLNFTSHINKRVKKAQTVKILIKSFAKTYGLVSDLVHPIQLLIIQSTALYSAKLQLKNQNNYEQIVQHILYLQVHSINEKYLNTYLHPLFRKADLIPACITLETCQRLYIYQLLSLPDQYLVKRILPISLRIEEGTFQRE